MLHTAQEIGQLAMGKPDAENYGPQTNHPFLAFDLTKSDNALNAWLSSRPCPTIGIGNGGLANACDIVLPDENDLPLLAQNISQTPIASMILVQKLRSSEHLNLSDTLVAESFAYGTVQTGPEFQNWLAQYDSKALPINPSHYVEIELHDGILNLTLNHPEARNAIGVSMRDALCEALDLGLLDTSISKVTLTGNGSTFSTGGAIEEFGEVSDPATAHWIRSLRLPAKRLVQLKARLEIHVNGAAIGAGAEIAAFGDHITASPNAWFQLPELKYGLIPGAGGTASIPNRIGRQKTAYMALTMKKIRAQTALDWGLIDAIID